MTNKATSIALHAVREAREDGMPRHRAALAAAILARDRAWRAVSDMRQGRR